MGYPSRSEPKYANEVYRNKEVGGIFHKVGCLYYFEKMKRSYVGISMELNPFKWPRNMKDSRFPSVGFAIVLFLINF